VSKPLVLLAVLSLLAALRPARADDEVPKKTEPGAGAAEMFAELDANKDGQLSTDEVPNERKRLFERLVRTADSNSDGKLSGEEFAAGLKGDADKPQKPGAPDRPRREREGDRKQGVERIFKRLDANGDGKVAADEVPEERREMFGRLLKRGDKDSDGSLSEQEFAQAFPGADDSRPEGFKKGKRPEGGGEPQRFFRRLDANGDGKLTADEVPEPARPRIEKLISRADKNGDKALSLEEFSAVPRPGQPPDGRPDKPRPERPDRPRGPGGPRGGPPGLFGALDTDHDGKLSGDEISASVEIIKKLDKDGDGSVTIEELVAAGPDKEKKD
jgi:Ca2+-binding EF-hand superfamily protein